MLNLLKKFQMLHLKYYFDAARLKSVSKSAELNCVTQSTVSQAIHKLEHGLQKQLITHQRNQFQLTQEGGFLLQELKPLLNAWKAFEQNLFYDADNLRGQLEINTTAGLASHFLYPFINQFSEQHPEVQINIRLQMPDQLVRGVEKGDVEFGVLIENMDLSHLDASPLFEGHFNAFRLKSSKKKLSEEKMILTGYAPETSHIQPFYERTFNKPLPNPVTLSSWVGIAKYIKDHGGVGYFPDYIAMCPEYRKSLSPCFDGKLSKPYRIVFCSAKDAVLSRIISAFLEVFD